jgi:hypothetical protein
MNQARFPSEWQEERVRRVLAHYEEQTEEDALLRLLKGTGGKTAGATRTETDMNVPHDLVPAVREPGRLVSAAVST